MPEVIATAARLLRSLLPALAGSAVLAACLTTDYQASGAQTPPAVPLNIEATQPPLAASLRTLIVFDLSLIHI